MVKVYKMIQVEQETKQEFTDLKEQYERLNGGVTVDHFQKLLHSIYLRDRDGPQE